MHTEPRNGATIDRIYLHTNEGPQNEGAAYGLHAYLLTIDAGYHVIVDDKYTVVCAGDDQVVWAEGGDNSHALSVCMIGFSASTDWTSPYSAAMIGNAAKVVAAWCKAYNVPVVHVRPGAPGQAPTDRGIAEHADDHNPASEGHTDPGARFPIDQFIAIVSAIVSPPPDYNAIAKLAQWAHRVSVAPLHVGDTSEDVTSLKELLAHAGFPVWNNDPFYGQKLVGAVHAFKLAHHLSNLDGSVFGAEAVQALGL